MSTTLPREIAPAVPDKVDDYFQVVTGTIGRNVATKPDRPDRRSRVDRAETPKRYGFGKIDQASIDSAISLIEEGDFSDAKEKQLCLASLGAKICELWEPAQSASLFHQQLLIAVDNAAMLLVEGLDATNERLSAIREGLVDSKLAMVTQANVDTVNSRLIDVGFSPFPRIQELAEDVS